MMQIGDYGIKEPDDIIWAMEKLWADSSEKEIVERLKLLIAMWDGSMGNPTRFSGMLPWVVAKLFVRLRNEKI
jgi:hypothetical protein